MSGLDVWLGDVWPNALDARLWTVRRSPEGLPDYFRIADNPGVAQFDQHRGVNRV